MHRRRGFTLIELLIVMVLMGLLASIAANTLWRAKDRGLVAAMQNDLRALATLQEHYHPETFAYAADLASLPDFTPSPGVTVTLTFASPRGWAAQAQHHSYVGHTCGIYFGDASPADGAPATQAGTIACD